MVIHYLQSGCSPCVLPCLQATRASFFTTWKAVEIARYINDPLPADVISFHSTNSQTIGELFSGFFDHYCKFNWTRDGISVRHGRNVSRPLKRGSNNTYLYVEDPYETNCNTARGVFNFFAWNDILSKFRKANHSLKQGKSFNDII